MSLRRVGGLAAVALASALWMSCGQVYRPVVIPINTIPPNPANFHAVFSVNANVPFNQGTLLQIDVSGDSEIGAANMGVNPTHGASLRNNSLLLVASAGSLFSGEADVVTEVTPAVDSPVATGLGLPLTYTLPYGSLPVFVNSSETSNAYVANFGTNSVSALSLFTSAITMTEPAGNRPVALAETPDTLNLYVADQTDNALLDLAPSNLTPIATIPVGNAPTWMTLRPDGQRLYVVTQGDGQLYTINTATNTQVAGSPQSLGGPGANFALYDKGLNRLYATNPNAGAVYIFDATTDPPTPVGSPTGALAIPAPAPCVGTPGLCNPVMPVGVAALPDMTRFYVASYATAATGSLCPDPNLAVAGCVIPQVTVFDAANFYVNGQTVVKSTVFPLLPSVAAPVAGVQPFAVAPVPFCVPSVPYSPSFSRFRMSAAAAPDSTHVYSSICDAGSVADIVTATNTISQQSNTPDTLVTDLAAPFGVCRGTDCGQAANITGFSITSDVVTFSALNSFVPGEQVSISGLKTTAGLALDGLQLTVLSTGLSGSQFECSVSLSDAPLTVDSGTALSSPVANVTSFSIANNVVTFQAINDLTPGTEVAISELSSPAGLLLDGQTLTVLGTGLSRTQFECAVFQASVGTTTDSGSATPLPPPQSPIFLFNGQ